jgi:ATP-dependent DNA helicase HFM1/MER3
MDVFRIDDIHRPVPIKKVVLTFPCPQKVSDFCFDLKLNYKLGDVINKYSNDKPTLIVNIFF